MNPVAFSIGPLQVHWYGIMIVLGTIIAAFVATVEARRRGEDPDHVWNMLPWLLIFGIIGARLYHVFSNPVGGQGWSYYREHPIDIINFWNGGFRGLGIYGAIVGGGLAMFLYCVRHHLVVARWLDIFAPGILLAQAIGRTGNRINQELYGPPTTLPWGFKIDPTYGNYQIPTEVLGKSKEEIEAYIATTRFHPTFFYEALWNLIGFGLLMWIGRRFYGRLRDGDVFLMYMIWYPLGRFIIEMFRPDAWISGIPGLTTAQVIGLVSIIAAVVLLFLRHRNWRPEPAQAAGDAESPA